MALSPSLIVLLLSSLVTFIVTCLQGGQYALRTSYIWFMFILGAVFIARLAIESSRGYTLLYSAVLGGGTVFVLSQFVGASQLDSTTSVLFVAAIVGGVWYLADRITFNCTLIDEDRDVSGRGLLDGNPQPPVAADTTLPSPADRPRKPRRRRQRPGVSVLWLTAAALPIFGFGSLITRSSVATNGLAQACLAVFLTTAMMLLVTTSFLSTRRYLRQRQLSMPGGVASAWLSSGAALTMLLVFSSFLLPVPGKWLAQQPNATPNPTPSAEPDHWLDASRWGWGRQPTRASDQPASDATTDAPAESSGQQEPQAAASAATTDPQSNEPQPASAPPSGESNQGDQPTQSTQTDSQSADNRAADNAQASDQSAASDRNPASDRAESPPTSSTEPSGEPAATPDTPASSQAAESTPPQMNWHPQFDFRLPTVFLLLAIVLSYVVWYRDAIRCWWLQWLARHKRRSSAAAAPSASVSETAASPPRPFASFRDPRGTDVPLRQAIIDSFLATEAWYRESGRPRQPQETPHDYARRLAATDRRATLLLPNLADAYGRMIYADSLPLAADRQTVESVWALLTSAEP